MKDCYWCTGQASLGVVAALLPRTLAKSSTLAPSFFSVTSFRLQDTLLWAKGSLKLEHFLFQDFVRIFQPCCHPSCSTGSTLACLVTFPPDNWISPPLGKFRTNLPILRRKLLLMELWEARYLVSQRLQSVHQLVCHLWQNFCFGLKEAGRRGALPCNSMQLAWQQLSFTLGVAKKSKALGLLVQLYTKLDSALQATAEYPAALSLSSCHIGSQKNYILGQ